MTLAQNAQGWLDLLVVAARELEILGDTPERQANIVRIKRQVVDALLAEWSAGEGLEEAAEAIGFTLGYGKGTYREAAEAAAPLIRAPLMAEVETLRGQLAEYESYPRRPLPGGMTPEEELDYWRSETLALDTWHDLQNKRVSTAEARVQRLEAALKEIDHLYPSLHAASIARRALLPEETTK